jgi:hypothetical protein
MRLPFVVLSLCLPLPLLTGCPGGGTGEEGAVESTTSQDPTVADDASTTAATDTTASPATETGTTSPVDTETDTAPPDTDTETGGPIAGCECILDEEPVDMCAAYTAPTCGETLCPLASGDCAEGYCSKGGPFVLADPAALECALMALRDRTPGIVEWRLVEGDPANGPTRNENGYVLVNADGSAVRRHTTREDLGYGVSDAVLGELPAPEAFDACLADPDDLARFECLRAQLEPALGVCDEAWGSAECI